MELTLHKLKEGFVITSDEQPLRDYKGLMLNRVSLSLTNDMEVSLMGWFLKVIAQQDQIDFSALSEEEQREIGWFNVDKYSLDNANKFALEKFDAESLLKKYPRGGRIKIEDIISVLEVGVNCGFKFGYNNKTQELQSDRMFTLDHMQLFAAYLIGKYRLGEIKNVEDVEKIIESYSRKSWKIEVEMERTRYPKGDDGWEDVYEPKFTGGKIKILKIKH